MNFTKVFHKNITALNNDYKVIVNYGGSSSIKTISIMQLLRLIAEKHKRYIVLCASSIPKLKTTLIKDFQNIIMGDSYSAKNYNKQDMIYKFANGSIFKFMSADIPANFTGPRFDYVLLDEINTFRHGEEIFNQLDIRTKYIIFPTFNPAAKFWITKVMARDDCKVIHSTYKDNQFIDSGIIEKLEQRAETDPNFYKVYTLGEWGALEGLVFKFKTHWDYYTKEPTDYDNIFFGGDFGFTNDPTTAVQIKVDRKNKTVYIKELLYSKGLLNSQIAEILKPVVGPNNWIIFDSAEPKSISSLRNEHGLNAMGAVKGQDSIRAGIERMKEWKILIQENSKNLINEFFNYAYIDKDGITNIPIDNYNHLIDAARYVFLKYRL